VYGKGLAAVPKSSQLENNVAFLAQEWAKDAAQATGAPAAVEALRSMRSRFPAVKELASIAKATMDRVSAELVAKGLFEDAVAAADAAAGVLDTDEQREEALVRAYERWAVACEKAAAWEDAVGAWAKAIERLPKSGHAADRAAGTWDRFAKTFFQKDWDAAIAIYDRALKALPGVGLLENNRKYAVAQKAK